MIIWDNFSSFCMKTYVVDHHLNRLNETVQMRAHNITYVVDPHLNRLNEMVQMRAHNIWFR